MITNNALNVKLFEKLKIFERIQDAWSWNGKVFARGRNGAGPFVVELNTNVDAILDIHNKGAWSDETLPY